MGGAGRLGGLAGVLRAVEAPLPGNCQPPARGPLSGGCAVFDRRSPLLCRGRKGPKAQLAATVSRALWGSPVQPAPWGPLERTEIR